MLEMMQDCYIGRLI